MARRIGGAGGGSDKGSGGGLLVAVVAAVAIGAGGTTVAAGAGSTAASNPRSTDRDTRTIEARLTAQGVRVTGRYADDTDDCAEHAYGQVREFVRQRPCTSLERTYFEIRGPAGDVVLVAVSWVEMPDVDGARDFHRLVDGSGTGNITELSRERGRYRSVRYTGDVYVSDRDGTVVVNAQAEPVARRASGLALTTLVNEAIR